MEVDAIIARMTQCLRGVKGVECLVLGGSRARQTHTPDSDIDLGIYYSAAAPLELEALQLLAQQNDDQHREQLLTAPGAWGRWINGGGWLTVNGLSVDWLYRDLDLAAAVIEDCLGGQIQIDYQKGHPHGFASHMFMAEVALSQPLWDPLGKFARLKSLTQPYPALLKEAVIKKFQAEAEFSIRVARKSLQRADVAYVAGCCFRTVACLMQVLFAINEQYFMNEKGAVALASTFARRPEQLEARVNQAFAHLRAEPNALSEVLDLFSDLAQEIKALTPAL